MHCSMIIMNVPNLKIKKSLKCVNHSKTMLNLINKFIIIYCLIGVVDVKESEYLKI